MDWISYIEILLAGLGAGFFSGLFGLGGGIIILPTLTLLFGLDTHLAIGTSLAALLFPTNFNALLNYKKASLLPPIKTIGMVAIGIMFGNALGAFVSINTISEILATLFGIYLLIIGIRYIKVRLFINYIFKRKIFDISKKDQDNNYRNISTINQWLFVLIGFLAGILAGLFGIGGGLVITIISINMFNINPKQATALSLAAMFLPVGIIGALQYNVQSNINWIFAIIIAIGIEISSAYSSKLAIITDVNTYKRIFGIVLLILGLYYISKNYILTL